MRQDRTEGSKGVSIAPNRGNHAATLLAPRGLLFVSTPNMDTAVWRALYAQKANPYLGELEHFHCFSRARLCTLLRDCGFEPLHYAVSTRYRSGMDVIARLGSAVGVLEEHSRPSARGPQPALKTHPRHDGPPGDVNDVH